MSVTAGSASTQPQDGERGSLWHHQPWTGWVAAPTGHRDGCTSVSGLVLSLPSYITPGKFINLTNIIDHMLYTKQFSDDNNTTVIKTDKILS